MCPAAALRARRSPHPALRAGLGPHPLARGIERRLAEDRRRTLLAQDLDLEGALARFRCERDRNVPLRQRAIDTVAVAAGSDPADDFAAVPDGLITEDIGVGGFDREAQPPKLAARLALLARGRAADEF